MNIINKFFVFLLLFPTCLFAKKYSNLDEFFRDVSPIVGPQLVNIGSQAQINLKSGYVLFKGEDVKKLCDFTQNLYNGEIAVLIPINFNWYAFFSYVDSGYVKEEKIDANKIFSAMKQNEPDSNKERERMGYGKLFLKDWFFKPTYNPLTNNLEWAFLIENEKGDHSVNFNTRILGRTGYMSVELVMAPEQRYVINEFQNVMSGFEYKRGSKYAEWRAGDKVAKYGIGALIAGGATVVAAKSGLFAKFGKFIVIAGIAIVGWVASLFKKLIGR